MDIKVGDIQKIYGLKSRQAVYDRVNALKTKGLEVSWDTLNKLNAHLKEGNTLADFALVELAPLAAEYSSLPALSLAGLRQNKTGKQAQIKSQ
jgi:hypothetical protein